MKSTKRYTRKAGKSSQKSALEDGTTMSITWHSCVVIFHSVEKYYFNNTKMSLNRHNCDDKHGCVAGTVTYFCHVLPFLKTRTIRIQRRGFRAWKRIFSGGVCDRNSNRRSTNRIQWGTHDLCNYETEFSLLFPIFVWNL